MSPRLGPRNLDEDPCRLVRSKESPTRKDPSFSDSNKKKIKCSTFKVTSPLPSRANPKQASPTNHSSIGIHISLGVTFFPTIKHCADFCSLNGGRLPARNFSSKTGADVSFFETPPFVFIPAMTDQVSPSALHSVTAHTAWGFTLHVKP